MWNQRNLAEVIQQDPKFSIFLKALRSTSLIDSLSCQSPLTVLAPANLAFTRLPETQLVRLMQPPAKNRLREILMYHFIAGQHLPDDLVRLSSAETLHGQRVTFEAADAACRVNGINLKEKRVDAANGIVYSISTLLVPADAARLGH